MPRQRNRHIAIKVTEQEYIRIKERINVSGLTQTQYTLHALLYGRVVVVGSRENIDYMIRRVEEMEFKLQNLYEKVQTEVTDELVAEITQVKDEYSCVLATLLELVHEADIQVKK